jgi:hypothetical protein
MAKNSTKQNKHVQALLKQVDALRKQVEVLGAAIEQDAGTKAEERVKTEIMTKLGIPDTPPTGRKKAAKDPAAPKAPPRECKVPGCSNPSKGPRFRYLCQDHREPPAPKATAESAASAEPLTPAESVPAPLPPPPAAETLTGGAAL